MDTVVVTGASTGIGLATAQVLVQNGFRVVGSVRKKADGETVKQQLGSNFEYLLMDVTDLDSIKSAAETVKKILGNKKLAGLVNNAGIAIGGPLALLPLSDFRKQIETNLISIFNIIQTFLPLLGTDTNRTGTPGRIVNISSVSGKNGAPFLGAYCTSKHALEGYSESLRREMMLYGIKVIVVGPGSVVTPIWDKAEKSELDSFVESDYGQALSTFKDYVIGKGRKGLKPEVIGQVVLKALTAANPRVRYAVVPNLLSDVILPALLSRKLVDKIIAKNFGLKQKT